MLYSYLLNQGEFHLEPVSTDASRDKRFAQALCHDLLMTIVRLSGYRLKPTDSVLPEVDDNKYLPKTKVVESLRADSEIRKLCQKSDFSALFPDALIEEIHHAITRSSAYRSFIRIKSRTVTDDVHLWTSVLNTVVRRNPQFIDACRQKPDFTTAGYDRAFLLATEALESMGNVKELYLNARSTLKKSLDKAYHLYHCLLWLPVELTRLEDQRLDAARHKFLAKAEDLNPDTRFVDNEMVKALQSSKQLEEYFNANPHGWNENPILLRKLLELVVKSDIYAEYMAAPSTDLKNDCDFWRNIFRLVILPSDDLAEALENESVYWNDDLDIVSTFVTKTMRRIAMPETASDFLLPQFKDEEDASFGDELFMDTIDNFDEYRSLIDRFIDRRQWDTERLALMDVIIMATAISELLNYPAIPIPVTLNEYIEIANSYSTPKSGQFVNGILYSVITYLREEGRLNKK